MPPFCTGQQANEVQVTHRYHSRNYSCPDNTVPVQKELLDMLFFTPFIASLWIGLSVELINIAERSSLALVTCHVPPAASSATIAHLVICTEGSEAGAQGVTTPHFYVVLLCSLVCLYRMGYSGSYT